MACAPKDGACACGLPGFGAFVTDDDCVPEDALAILRTRARRVLVAWRRGGVPHGTQPEEEALAKLLCCLQRNSAEIRPPYPQPWPQPMQAGASWATAAQGIFTLTSFTNAACAPTAAVCADGLGGSGGDGGQLRMRCVLPLRAGEEVTISYCPWFWTPEQRRKHLRQAYFFECTCDRCLEAGKFAPSIFCSAADAAPSQLLEVTKGLLFANHWQLARASLERLMHEHGRVPGFEETAAFNGYLMLLALINCYGADDTLNEPCKDRPVPR